MPAGGDGGFCHVFVLLLVLEHFSPSKADCVLPGPQSAVEHLFQEHYPSPEPVMSRTFEKSKLAVNRKRSAVDCSLFEARGPKLAAVCSKVCVRFFRSYEYTPPPLSLSLRLQPH